VNLAEDNKVSFITPRTGVVTVLGQITMVCYAGPGQTGCGYGQTNTPAGTWSRVSGKVLVGTDISAGGMLSPASLARGIAAGQWRIVRRTRLEGQPAIELSETSHGPDVIEPLPTLLWVNARTHLPIRMVNGVGSASVTRDEWAYLPPTAANLKLLEVHIPPGTRVTSRSAEFFAWCGMAAWVGREAGRVCHVQGRGLRDRARPGCDRVAGGGSRSGRPDRRRGIRTRALSP
jgi:hypothetical protein